MTKVELGKVYQPGQVESTWNRNWNERGHFHPDPDSEAEPYTIVIPPPNVTGILHMGHVLNNTIQDIFIRRARMQGKNTLWLPGTDHASIATEAKIVRQLKDEGTHKRDLGRDKFLDRAWDWSRNYGGTIIEQLKRLGCSCDWERQAFTMDDAYYQAVMETFVRLYDDGFIYRGERLINWDPLGKTALSDEEVIHRETEGSLWYFRYPLSDGSGHIQVATTRPETMLGDTGVAVSPSDKRYKKFIGKTVILPLVGRKIPVFADEFVDPEFGTGAVKVTPAHDPNDFDIGQRHNLEQINVMNPNGTMNKNAGKFSGMDRYACREALVAELKKKKLLEKTEAYQVPVALCYRCRTEIEPYLSEQWFVKMKPLAQPAIEAVKTGKLRFYPEHWTKTYMYWMENIRDWCISRQLWWGHRIPVWYCQDCDQVVVSKTTPTECTKCKGKNLRQDEDVLDTWFSSALWPFSTLGWPDETSELERYYPTSVLITGFDIIFFWVA
ncbi:MAG: valine--tRNA ligase, partial [Candidatus Marinimicrobia bacterium]|nr:valine--tRNA ligase [Candidatus Neomarinimicrobiota bacterium]